MVGICRKRNVALELKLLNRNPVYLQIHGPRAVRTRTYLEAYGTQEPLSHL